MLSSCLRNLTKKKRKKSQRLRQAFSLMDEHLQIILQTIIITTTTTITNLTTKLRWFSCKCNWNTSQPAKSTQSNQPSIEWSKKKKKKPKIFQQKKKTKKKNKDSSIKTIVYGLLDAIVAVTVAIAAAAAVYL